MHKKQVDKPVFLHHGICSCCKGTVYSARNGITQRHTAGGYHWKYTNNEPTFKTAHTKKVKCIETGVIYNSIKEAQETLKINNISRVCQKIPKYKTAGGYHWEYVKESEVKTSL